jgi:GT2 family glycosyltransferase
MTPGAMVGIACYNGWKRVNELLQNLRQRTGDSIPYTIVVCDDSGKDSHRALVREACQRYGATYIQNEHNRGVPSTWNALVKSTDHEVAIILNDDVLLAKDWLEYLHYAIKENPNAGSFSLSCLFIEAGDTQEIIKSAESRVIPLNVRYVNGVLIRNERFREMPKEEDHQPGRVMCPAGCAFGFRRETWERVGGFDERYFAFYEETDFGVACSFRGFPAFTLPVPLENYHVWSATFASAPEIPAGQIMNASRAKFVEKWQAILGVPFQDAPEIHSLIMDKIPLLPIKWLGVGKVRKEGTL